MISCRGGLAIFAALSALLATHSLNALGADRALVMTNPVIPGLTLETPEADIQINNRRGQSKVEARLQFIFNQEEWTLTAADAIREPGETKNGFFLWVPLTGPKTSIVLLAIGPRGEIRSQPVTVIASEWDELAIEMQSPSSRHTLIPGLSLAMTSVKDTRTSDFSNTWLTGSLRYSYWVFTPKLKINALASYSLLNIIKSDTRNPARLFEFDGSGSYRFYLAGRSASLLFHLGAYFRTMIISAGNYGFHNLSGPLFYPEFQKSFSRRIRIAISLRYSPIAQNLAVLAPTNREIAGNFSYQFRLRNRHWLSADLAASSLNVLVQTVQIQLTTYKLGLSYQL